MLQNWLEKNEEQLTNTKCVVYTRKTRTLQFFNSAEINANEVAPQFNLLKLGGKTTKAINHEKGLSIVLAQLTKITGHQFFIFSEFRDPQAKFKVDENAVIKMLQGEITACGQPELSRFLLGKFENDYRANERDVFINFFWQITTVPEEELLKIKHFGAACLEDWKRFLSRFALKPGDPLPVGDYPWNQPINLSKGASR